uniref:site-specific DNA-methyltransferase (adenine-specific) n=1 Tax=uncultured haloarchaeon TaxID=160804 RepID=A5YSB3_9EURY|nr:type II restriction enzyme, methylase subunits [uncultured haloarchaeon]
MSTESPSAATEFVEQAFETTVSETAENELIEKIDDTVRGLREQIDDETLEKILRAESGSYKLRSGMTRDGLQPESFTQQAVIEPILETLGHEYKTEAGGLSGGQTMVADYTVSLRDYSDIESTRLLIEAEPINKTLENKKHGIGQVRDWLSQREFQSDFGFATDGLRWAFVRYDPDSYSHNIIEKIDLQPIFLALFENQVGSRNSPTEAVFDADRERVTRLLRTFHFENFVSIAGDARQVIKQKQEQITDEFYEDYIQYVFGIVDDDDNKQTSRSLVADGVVKPEGATENDARLFAVELMNRLIFIKFLEDKSLVEPTLLRTLKQTYEDGMYTETLYNEFLQRLFYDVMNQKPENRSPHIQNIGLFEDIPYLNSGLFRPTIQGEDFTETDFDVRNSVLKSIIDLLEAYSFSAKGAPTELDPSVLGNVFEKTVNHITSDDADKNKELGAYYTQKEITRFCAEETVCPALLDRFQTTLVTECDWSKHEAERFDSVYELIEGLPGHMSTIGPLLDEVDEFRVVDPACGSGNFLTSVLEEIVDIRKTLYAQNESYPDEYRLKKTTVLNNIYGVDLMGPAVEIAKLRCWLSIISELETEDVDELAEDNALALPNIAFNLRKGNSLIGYTGFPETNGDDQYQLGSFNEDSVRDRYKGIIDEIEKHEESFDTETAEKHRRRAFEKLRTAREELIDDIHADFVEAGIEDITPGTVEEMQPFNWVLEFAEVYADGGFDVVVGNPPWDQVKPRRDEFFVRYEPRFRSLSLNERDELIENLLEQDSIQKAWDDYQRANEIQSTFFTDGDTYSLQSSIVDGRTRSTANELAALFLERVFQIAREDGYVSQVLPGLLWQGLSTKALRVHLLNETTIQSLITFENNGIFDNIDNRYTFGILTFENQGTTDKLRGICQQRSTGVLENFDKKTFQIPREVLAEYSPEGRIFPQVQCKKEVDTLRSVLKYPHLQDTDQPWFAHPYMELRQSTDADRLVESESDGDYPVIGGRNMYQFTHDDQFFELSSHDLWSIDESDSPEKSAKRRIREKKVRMVKSAVYDTFDGTGSKKAFVNELLKKHRGRPLSVDDVRLDCEEYRLVYRRIANATNERSLIAAVIPPGTVCHDGVYTVQPFILNPTESDLSEETLHPAYERVFTDPELFVFLGFINSIPFDFLIRTKIDTTIPVYKLEESQVPRLTEGDDWFNYIWKRAARLNCYGDEFDEMRDRLGGIDSVTAMNERRETQAELDAAAFHAYGLDREQTSFVLDDFHRVRNPRLMDEDYFDMVLKKYDELD